MSPRRRSRKNLEQKIWMTIFRPIPQQIWSVDPFDYHPPDDIHENYDNGMLK
jgi:hypothetical protein